MRLTICIASLLTLIALPARAEEAVHSGFGTYFAAQEPAGFQDPVDPAALADIAPASGEEDETVKNGAEAIEDGEEAAKETVDFEQDGEAIVE